MRHLALTVGSILTCAALGLSTPARAAGSSILSSDPPGIELAIRGPAGLSGLTPLDLEDLPAGEYEYRGRKSGVPAFRGRLVRSEDGITQKRWAGPGTILLPPGVVHLDRGERRGWIFLGGAAASAWMAVSTQGEVSDAENARNRAGREYESAVSEKEIRESRFALETAEQRVSDRKAVRDLWAAYFGAAAVGSFVEAVILTPQPDLESQADGGYHFRSPAAGRLRNAVRSALVPGSGQRYMGKEKRANLFALGIGVAGAAAIVTHSKFLDARRDQADAQRRYLSAETEKEIETARDALEDAAGKTNDRETLQWSVMGAAGALYLWNLLDAWGTGGGARPAPLAISTRFDRGELRLMASWRVQ